MTGRNGDFESLRGRLGARQIHSPLFARGLVIEPPRRLKLHCSKALESQHPCHTRSHAVEFPVRHRDSYERARDGGTYYPLNLYGRAGHVAKNVPSLNSFLDPNVVIDFVAHPEEIAANRRVAAFAGAWEWRYGSSWNDLNAIVDHDVAPNTDQSNFLDTVRGINGLPPADRLVVRVRDWTDMNAVLFDQNAYGNMSEVLKALGIKSVPKKRITTLNLESHSTERLCSPLLIQKSLPTFWRKMPMLELTSPHNGICLSNCKQILIFNKRVLIC